ncbi:MAG: hypothetical protein ABI597_06340 [Gammaproteobacteria bacterium]
MVNLRSHKNQSVINLFTNFNSLEKKYELSQTQNANIRNSFLNIAPDAHTKISEYLTASEVLFTSQTSKAARASKFTDEFVKKLIAKTINLKYTNQPLNNLQVISLALSHGKFNEVNTMLVQMVTKASKINNIDAYLKVLLLKLKTELNKKLTRVDIIKMAAELMEDALLKMYELGETKSLDEQQLAKLNPYLILINSLYTVIIEPLLLFGERKQYRANISPLLQSPNKAIAMLAIIILGSKDAEYYDAIINAISAWDYKSHDLALRILPMLSEGTYCPEQLMMTENQLKDPAMIIRQIHNQAKGYQFHFIRFMQDDKDGLRRAKVFFEQLISNYLAIMFRRTCDNSDTEHSIKLQGILEFCKRDMDFGVLLRTVSVFSRNKIAEKYQSDLDNLKQFIRKQFSPLLKIAIANTFASTAPRAIESDSFVQVLNLLRAINSVNKINVTWLYQVLHQFMNLPPHSSADTAVNKFIGQVMDNKAEPEEDKDKRRSELVVKSTVDNKVINQKKESIIWMDLILSAFPNHKIVKLDSYFESKLLSEKLSSRMIAIFYFTQRIDYISPNDALIKKILISLFRCDYFAARRMLGKFSDQEAYIVEVINKLISKLTPEGINSMMLILGDNLGSEQEAPGVGFYSRILHFTFFDKYNSSQAKVVSHCVKMLVDPELTPEVRAILGSDISKLWERVNVTRPQIYQLVWDSLSAVLTAGNRYQRQYAAELYLRLPIEVTVDEELTNIINALQLPLMESQDYALNYFLAYVDRLHKAKSFDILDILADDVIDKLKNPQAQARAALESALKLLVIRFDEKCWAKYKTILAAMKFQDSVFFASLSQLKDYGVEILTPSDPTEEADLGNEVELLAQNQTTDEFLEQKSTLIESSMRTSQVTEPVAVYDEETEEHMLQIALMESMTSVSVHESKRAPDSQTRFSLNSSVQPTYPSHANSSGFMWRPNSSDVSHFIEHKSQQDPANIPEQLTSSSGYAQAMRIFKPAAADTITAQSTTQTNTNKARVHIANAIEIALPSSDAVALPLKRLKR